MVLEKREMENVEKAIALKKELDSFRPLKKEDELRIMQKFRLELSSF